MTANTNKDAGLQTPIDNPNSAFMPTTSGSWGCLENLDWSDMQSGWSQQDLGLWDTDAHLLINCQNGTGATLVDPGPNPPGWTCAGNGIGHRDGQRTPPPPKYCHEQGHTLEEDLFKRNSRCSRNFDKHNSPEASIAQLAHLSTRLYPLHRSSRTLAECAESSSQSETCRQASSKTLVNDTTFKAVATWLVHVSANMESPSQYNHQEVSSITSSAGDILQDAFSASHQLLQILQSLQTTATISAPILPRTTSTSSSTSTAGAPPDFWTSITPESMQSNSTSDSNDTSSITEQHQGPTSHIKTSSTQYSNTVVRHLVIACHTLLLNIYTALLAALQQDADQTTSNSLNHDNVCPETTALADIRLVTTVQLCSYLIERQFQAMESYLPPHITDSSQQPSSPTCNPALVDDLKIEVQQRVGRLKNTLRI
ncbi:MAG: hypothetical protein Q9170_004237 [Blastenia crenularia]